MSTDQLIGQLREMHELRDLFLRWFVASGRKDVDAQMAPIADDIVAYEHHAPHEHRGAEAVRTIRAQALAHQSSDYRWDVPDLRIRIVGDIAIGWGLTRARDTGPDGTAFEEWSRGTQIFERRDGRWQMIHQHLSYPIDADGTPTLEAQHGPVPGRTDLLDVRLPRRPARRDVVDHLRDPIRPGHRRMGGRGLPPRKGSSPCSVAFWPTG